MAIVQSQAFCKRCGRATLHGRESFGEGWGCLLTVVTAGLFLPVWLGIALWEHYAAEWRCQVCGQPWTKIAMKAKAKTKKPEPPGGRGLVVLDDGGPKPVR